MQRSMTKFSNILKKKTIFGPISPFWRQKYFFKKSGFHTHHMDPQHHGKFKKKLRSQLQENFWTEQQKDGQALFHRTLLATARGPTSLLFRNIML